MDEVMNNKNQEKKAYSYKITRSGWLVIGLTVTTVVIILLLMTNSLLNSGGLAENKSDVQAVFLTNGHTYFGKVVSENEDSVLIRDIYYLQNETLLQQGADQNMMKDFSLVKLGNEIHGPFDEMRINRQHILFVEDLKNDSKVVGAIKKYQQSKNE